MQNEAFTAPRNGVFGSRKVAIHGGGVSLEAKGFGSTPGRGFRHLALGTGGHGDSFPNGKTAKVMPSGNLGGLKSVDAVAGETFAIPNPLSVVTAGLFPPGNLPPGRRIAFSGSLGWMS